MVTNIFDIFLIQTRMYNRFDSISSLSQVPYSTRMYTQFARYVKRDIILELRTFISIELTFPVGDILFRSNFKETYV